MILIHEKLDTLTPENINQFDFDVLEFKTVTPDSLYTFTASCNKLFSNVRYIITGRQSC
jgi:hypothetical protein